MDKIPDDDVARICRDVSIFARQQRRKYKRLHSANPHGFRDTHVRLLRRALKPPRRRASRRGTKRVLVAYRMWKRDRLRTHHGAGHRGLWLRIAKRCIPNYGALPDADRRLQLKRLQKAVHNRHMRAKKRVRKQGDASDPIHGQGAETS